VAAWPSRRVFVVWTGAAPLQTLERLAGLALGDGLVPCVAAGGRHARGMHALAELGTRIGIKAHGVVPMQ